MSSLLFKFSLLLIACVTSGFSNYSNNTTTNTNECENGLSAAQGYNAFIQYGVSVSSGDTEGPMAMGGDLTLDGTFTVAAHTGGTFYHNGETQAASLVINGKIIYKSNQGINLNQGFVKIGNLTGSNVYDKDNNNVTTNTRITPGSYDQSPRIHLQRNQAFSSVNAGNIIDFNAAFVKLNAASFNYSQLTNNVVIENGNKISLANNTTNVLHLTGNELNNLTNFTFNNQPTADSPLIINVNYAGDFSWNVQNQAGIGDQQGAFIIYNFYNSSKVIINGGGTIMGTVLAPSSDVEKRTSGNINGQVIAKSYIHLSGELHQHTYNHCEEKVCALTVDAGNKKVVCEGSLVTLTAAASGSNCVENISYAWSGPGIIGNTNEQSITVDTAGTYTVKAQDCDDCLAEDTVVVKINKNPEVTLTANNTNCYANEGSITFSFDDYKSRSHIKLSIDGGNSYVKVKDNIGSYTFNELKANTYDIAIKWGNNQCSVNLDSIILEELQVMSVDAGVDQEICSGDTVTLTAQIDTNALNQCSAVSYLWSTGETTVSINVSPTENTEYTVTSNNCGNCTAEDSVSVTVNEAPEADVTSQNGTCADTTSGNITFYFDAESDAANIDLSIDGGTTYTTVSTASGSYTFENLAAGSYNTSIRSNEKGCAVILNEVIIEEILSIAIDAGDEQEICSGESVTLTANTIEEDGIDDKPCTTFLWSTGETTKSITVTPTEDTEYTVSLTNCDYCTTEDSVSVTVNEAPEADVTSQNGTCANTTNGSITFYFDAESDAANIDLSIDGGTTYTTVSTASGSYTFENLAAGSYNTSIRSSEKGCAVILNEVIIEEILSIAIDAGDDQEICSGESVTLTANTIEEDGIDCKPCTKFLWSTGETTKSITVTPTEDTEYTVSLTNCDYCTTEDSVSVTVNEAPEADVTSQNGTCADTTSGSITFYFDAESDAANIDLSIDGGTTYTTVSTASGSYTFENLAAGSYNTSIRSSEKGCAVILDEVIIEEILSIAIDAGDDQEICSGESVTLTANTIEEDGIDCKPCTKFLWSTGETTKSITVTPTEDTEYTVSLTNCDYCTTEDSVSVTVNEAPEADVTSQNGTCANTTSGSITFYFDAESDAVNIDLSIDGGTTYTTVSTASGSYTYENLAAGSYNTSIRSSEDGCAVILDEVIIEEILSIAIDAGDDQEICSGESVTLTANTIEEDGIDCKPCTKFLWSTGETTKSITVTPTENTEYTVSLTNCDYCVIEDNVTVLVESISVDAGGDITIEYGEIGTLSVTPFTPGVNYLWSTGETGETISVSPTETTSYTVTAISEKGCYAEDNVTVEVIVDPCLSQEYNVIAYPVPVDAQGVLNIDIAINKQQMVNYTTYRLNGSRIGSSVDLSLPKGCNTVNVDLVKHCSFIANTQYILIVTGEGWVETIDFVTLP